VLVEIVLLGFRSASGRAASGRMRIAHVLTKFYRKRCAYCDGLLRRLNDEGSWQQYLSPHHGHIGADARY